MKCLLASCFFLACSPLIVAEVTVAEDWTGFRGSRGDGSSTETSAPVRWSATEGVAWSTPLPRGANGSPIVVGDQVLVTSAEDDKGFTRSLLSLNANSGEVQWTRSVEFGRELPTHKTNPHGGSTPVSNGKQVIVWHGSAGLYAYDMQGNELWHQGLGDFVHMWGYGTSPVISGDRVILHTGPGKQVFVAAFDLESGDEIWRHEEPIDGNGERNSDGQYMGSWSTPVLIEQAGATVAVTALATRVCGFDVATGKLLWFCEGHSGPKGDLAYSSPMIEGDLCVMIGGFKGPGFGFRLGGSGNITAKNRLWRNTSNPQNIGTGFIKDGYVYRVGAGPNMIDCLDAKTGEIVWQECAGTDAFWSSIVFNGKHAYATDQAGKTLVFKLSPTGYEQVAANDLQDRCNATAALANKRIYIRTHKKLWCIEGE